MTAKKFFLIPAMLFIFCGLYAQKDLNINDAFDAYGKNKGSVLVEISGKEARKFDFLKYKSLMMDYDKKAAAFVRQCVEKDEKEARKIKHISVNGITKSVYLELPKAGCANRLILFKEPDNQNDKLILIYIESAKDAEEVLNVILQKK